MRLLWWALLMPSAGLVVVGLVTVLVLAVSFSLVFNNRILPNVYASGISLGGLTQEEAAIVLRQEGQSVILRDGPRQWTVEAARLGITMDTDGTAALAYQQGRSQGSPLQRLFTTADLTPRITVNESRLRETLLELSAQFERAPVNAGVHLQNGRLQATLPVPGRTLALEPTLVRFQAEDALADWTLDLVMADIAPAVTDASPLVAEAERLLAHTLDFRVYDPVTGDTVFWQVPPETWSAWLSIAPDDTAPQALALTVDEERVHDYLTAQAAATFDHSRYIDVAEATAFVRESIEAQQPAGYVRVYHHDRQYMVQPGESLISIAWDHGVPYPWIMQANPGLGSLSPGQTITIPSPDNFLEFPVVPTKRIVVSISQQHAWVYENDQLKWDWTISTGIYDSPTWPGIYQIISHEPNAYAANWDLYMPHFMGVYRPIPGSNFTNGFHGFPTRGGSQLLWTNSLGTRVTYGCILLSNPNAAALYDWADEGVVVEIQG